MIRPQEKVREDQILLQYIQRKRQKASIKGHHVPLVPCFVKTCCFPFSFSLFFAALIEHTIKTENNKYISPLDQMFQSFKAKSNTLLYRLQNCEYTHSHCFLSLILSIWRWKDLSCCFLLLHYLLPCGALLAGFISDFAGCFWGSLWNVVLTPNNPFPAFSHLLQSPPLSW